MLASYKTARKLLIALIGGTIILVGAALLVLPGPGLLIVAGGLAVLGAEFHWAKRALAKMRRQISATSRLLRVPPGTS